MQRADEALHRSEMALELARQVSDRVQSPQKVAVPPAYAVEVVRLGELVRRLSTELHELRVQSEGRQRDPAPRPVETWPIVEQRLGADYGETSQQARKDRAEGSADRRFGWSAVVFSGLVGALDAAEVVLSVQHFG